MKSTGLFLKRPATLPYVTGQSGVKLRLLKLDLGSLRRLTAGKHPVADGKNQGDNNQSNDYALRFWVDVHSRQLASVNKPCSLAVYFSQLARRHLRKNDDQIIKAFAPATVY
jgi:hypothetical protein